MGRRPGMTLDQRNMAIGMLTAGRKNKDVARHFQVSESSISRLRAKFRQTGSVKDRPRTGRPRKTTGREDNYMVTSSRRDRFLSGTKIACLVRNATGTRICNKTVQRRLRSARLRSRRPYVGVPLTVGHKRARLNWATLHRRWTRRQWNEVVFTDESRFNLKFSDGRVRVWRRRGERMDPANVVERDRYGGGSVMVWAGITNRAKTDIVSVRGNLNAVRYCNEIIRPVVLPFMRQGHAQIFQQDNARPHVARHTMDLLRANNVNVLDWPAKSPDLSPIEHLWDHMGRKVRERDNVNNVMDLERALHQEWNRIPMAVIQRLISSMRRRCVDVCAVNGGHTKY